MSINAVRAIIAAAVMFCAHCSLAATSLWQVSKNKQVFYLGASISALQQKHYPLPVEFDYAFKKSSLLVVERDIAAVSAQEFGAQVMKRMMYTDGGNLKKHLRPDIYQKLEAYGKTVNVPVFGLAMFKPAFAMVTLAAAQTAQQEYVYGVDTHYFYSAIETKKPWQALETTAAQLDLLDKVNREEPNRLMSYLLDELSQMTATLGKIERPWRTGKLEAIDGLAAGKLRTQTPALYQALVMDRHKNWLPAFDKMAQTPEVELVLLDIIHFTGPDSLLTLLKKNGYTLTPFRITQ